MAAAPGIGLRGTGAHALPVRAARTVPVCADPHRPMACRQARGTRSAMRDAGHPRMQFTAKGMGRPCEIASLCRQDRRRLVLRCARFPGRRRVGLPLPGCNRAVPTDGVRRRAESAPVVAGRAAHIRALPPLDSTRFVWLNATPASPERLLRPAVFASRQVPPAPDPHATLARLNLGPFLSRRIARSARPRKPRSGGPARTAPRPAAAGPRCRMRWRPCGIRRRGVDGP